MTGNNIDKKRVNVLKIIFFYINVEEIVIKTCYFNSPKLYVFNVRIATF